MFKILLHSSKTMKPVPYTQSEMSTPLFLNQAREIQQELLGLSSKDIATIMKISDKLAVDVRKRIKEWKPSGTLSPAALTFRGDIYSGLQAQNWNKKEQAYATDHLWILSGLYGILRPFDAISPYRLEMGYPLNIAQQSLYDYWSEALDAIVAENELYINLTADEYLKAIKKSLTNAKVIAPKFLTVSLKTGEPIFVTVHAKVARGAFANWMITNQVQDIKHLREFHDLGYSYNEEQSTDLIPVFICKDFGGIGLSTRLS